MRLPLERIDQSGQQAFFAFLLCGAITSLSTPQPGVEQIPHGVAEQVEAVDRHGQAQPGPERQPRRNLHVLATLATQHAAPARDVRRQAEAQEAQRGLGDDDATDVDAEDDDERRSDIGQHMAEEDPALAGSQRLGGLEVIVLLDADHRAAYHPRGRDATGDTEHQDDLQYAAAGDRHDGEQQE